ncbi:MAG: PAS domain S-box protein [SAR202 cluster bacterium]|nr:PAS domain S-box protein [SAR202 cluster bacterium]
MSTCNQALLDLTGHGRDELVGRSAKVLAPAEVALTEWDAPGAGAPPGVRVAVWNVLRKDGATLECEVAARHLAHKGQFSRIVTFRDVTEQRRRLAASRLAVERYEALLEAAPVAVISFDADGTCTAVNPTFLRITGHAPDEVIGKPGWDLVHPEERGIAIAANRRIRDGEVPGPRLYRVRARDGGYRTLRLWTATIRRDGKFAGVMAVAQDVTDEARQEADLHAQATILANVRESIVVTDADGAVRYWNQDARERFGYSDEEVLGRDSAMLFAGARTAGIPGLRAAAGSRGLGQSLVRRKDGSTFWVEYRASPMVDKAGGVTGHIAVMRGITHRKELEATIAQLTTPALEVAPHLLLVPLVGAATPPGRKPPAPSAAHAYSHRTSFVYRDDRSAIAPSPRRFKSAPDRVCAIARKEPFRDHAPTPDPAARRRPPLDLPRRRLQQRGNANPDAVHPGGGADGLRRAPASRPAHQRARRPIRRCRVAGRRPTGGELRRPRRQRDRAVRPVSHAGRRRSVEAVERAGPSQGRGVPGAPERQADPDQRWPPGLLAGVREQPRSREPRLPRPPDDVEPGDGRLRACPRLPVARGGRHRHLHLLAGRLAHRHGRRQRL